MLQTELVNPQIPYEEAGTLDPWQYLEILRKRVFYAILPFILVLTLGTAAAYLWPRTYLSEGKILVESQQIPETLVQPTVTASPEERLAVLQQRVTTRQNLLAILDKYHLYADQRQSLSRTELLGLMRDNIKITPIDLGELKKTGRKSNTTIALTVGFYSGRSDVATKVANDLMTLFLKEDVRSRTIRASETTRFLQNEVEKLRSNLDDIDKKILDAKIKLAQAQLGQGNVDPKGRVPQLAALRAQLAAKSAVFSPSHPEIKALEAQIRALEKLATSSPAASSAPGSSPSPIVGTNDISNLLAALTKRRDFVQSSLDTASKKLAAAQMGEKLERDQYAERLEVLEQPVRPQKPVKPNVPKFMAITFIASVMAAFAGVFTIETFDRTIRGGRDLLSVANANLLITIPHIVTIAELRRKRARKLVLVVFFFGGILLLLAAVNFFVRPLDELWPLLIRRFMTYWSAF